MTAVGILGIGRYLPAHIRRNDWWSDEVVKSWSWAKPAPTQPPIAADDITEAGARVLREMQSQAQDPFRGAIERRVAADDESTTDMELRAAEDALARAGIDRSAIDVLLTHSVAPDYLLSNPAALLHARLGLPRECFAMQTESAAYGFLHQLSIAQSMIETGHARYALLVQSSLATRLVDPDDVEAPYFGDGATAVVVGPVSTRGIRGAVHYTDGRFADTIVMGIPGKRWYDDGRPFMHVRAPSKMRAMLLQTIDLVTESVAAALDRAGCSPSDVSFFCIHQGTPWLRRLAQEATGLTHASTIETFTKTGYLFSAILPLGLRAAEDASLLRAGDIVVVFGGGTGMTYGATVIEWGRE